MARATCAEASSTTRAASHAHLKRRRNQPLAHEGLENLRQNALVVRVHVFLQYVTQYNGIGNDHEDLGSEAQLVHPAALGEVLVQGQEQRAPDQVVDHALGRNGAVLQTRVLFGITIGEDDIGHPHGRDVSKCDILLVHALLLHLTNVSLLRCRSLLAHQLLLQLQRHAQPCAWPTAAKAERCSCRAGPHRCQRLEGAARKRRGSA